MAEYRNVGDMVCGDTIKVECRDPGKWKLIQMSGQHKGSICIAKKNAKATIVKSYTNVKNSDKK